MYSSFIKFTLTLTALSPILATYWIVNTIQNFRNLSIYLKIDTIDNILLGVNDFLKNHYLIILFISVVFFCRYILKKAVNSLTIGSINVKSIKPADIQFNAVLFSFLLPFLKLFINDSMGEPLFYGTILLCLVSTMISKSSYHYNLIFRFFLGYRNYEIQTKMEVTYLMLSRQKLINPNQITKYVQLTDYMLININ